MTYVLDVRALGAAGDGEHSDTPAIQAAVDRCAEAGGGTVLVPKGAFRTGTIFLKSNVTLHLTVGAVLLGSRRLEDYPAGLRGDYEGSFPRCLLYAESAANVTLTGSGVIDGQGGQETPLTDRSGNPVRERPMLMRFYHCRRVTLSGLVLRNAYAWCTHLSDCEDVWIDRVTVESYVDLNNDGFDIENCRNVFLSNCKLHTADDAICLKSSAAEPCANIVVTNCIVSSGTAALKFGTISVGGFRGITVSNCVFHDCVMGAIKLLLVDGGILEDVSISNIVMHHVDGPLFIRLAARKGAGRMRGINISNIVARMWEERPADTFLDVYKRDYALDDLSFWGLMIAGIPGARVEDVVLDNIRLIYPGGGAAEHAAQAMPEDEAGYPEQCFMGVVPGWGAYLRHVQGIKLSNMVFGLAAPDARPAIVCDDAIDVTLDGLTMDAVSGASPQMRFENAREVRVSRCRVRGSAGTFAAVAGNTTRDILISGNDLRHMGRTVALGDEICPDAVVLAGNIGGEHAV